MLDLTKAFGHRRAFLPVIHHAGPSEARDSIEVAARSGADGVFLITQGASLPEVFALAQWTKENFPALKRGVNPLGETRAAFAHADIDAVWTDESVVDLASDAAQTLPDFLQRRTIPWCGGCAFKTHAELGAAQQASAARIAAKYMDVVTTSGAGTGIAAPLEKVQRLHAAIAGAACLGLASGVTPENVGPLLPYVDVYIVASGIERAWGELDAPRTRALAEQIHGA